MKKALLLAAIGGLVAGALPARARDAAPPRVTVTFDHPERFTDVKDYFTPTDKGRQAILNALQDYLVRQGDRLLRPGYHLSLVFKDIDLAGDFEPWRGPDFDEIRIVKPLYPPSFKFSYQLTNPQGQVVRQGSEDLKDLDFLQRAALDQDDPLRFEKALLEQWLLSHVTRPPA